MYSNPVINNDFPDPNCLEVQDTFYVFATNSCQTPGHIQLATSQDLVQYQLQPDALPNLPTWAKPGRTWAPNVTHIQDSTGSTFVMYFVAWDADTDRQAIGLATSKTPEGPYVPAESRPLIIQVNALLALPAFWLVHGCICDSTDKAAGPTQPHS